MRGYHVRRLCTRDKANSVDGPLDGLTSRIDTGMKQCCIFRPRLTKDGHREPLKGGFIGHFGQFPAGVDHSARMVGLISCYSPEQLLLRLILVFDDGPVTTFHVLSR